MDTRGIVFDMSDFLETAQSENVREIVGRYKDFEEVDYEYVLYHTASHFFLHLVSDISAVNNSMLFYGFDQDAEEVYVFERTEGGQGIVDLVYDELDSDPGTVLEAINRLVYNPQVINERLWANEEFVSALPTDPEAEGQIESEVASALNIPYETVTERVVQEVFSSVDKANQFAADEGISLDDAYRIKYTIAAHQISGGDEYPEEQIENMEIEVSDVERPQTVFYSPDIDGCVENLHLAECIASDDQSETLSYIALEALRENITHSVPSTETSSEMFDRNHIPAGEFDETSVFLDF